MNTGYNIHEGSDELARRRAMRDHDRDVADAMLRNARSRALGRKAQVRGLARLALAILATPTPRHRHPW